ncbi:MAG: hypothetical protein M3P06_21450 [Acidobacteriota bacterium]|nr:hypothetical protein [Acidobacteriota bacterium]
MRVFTPKRAVLFVVAVLLGASAFASNPSPRAQARMVWDIPSNVGILFGGLGPFDGATGLQHDSAETWLWNGSRWLQRFPATIPPRRAVHSMVWDSTRNRAVMFGGRQSPVESNESPVFLNDTWVYESGNWRKIESPENPPVRQFGAMAYDRSRDRVVLYGGNILTEDEDGEESFEARFDTWEFDGERWAQVGSLTPAVAKPILAYDAARNETILIGLNDTGTAIVMYRYDAVAHAWNAVTPEKFPTCVNDGHMVYQEHRGRLLFLGGVCATNTPVLEEAFEWDAAANTWNTQTIGGLSRGSAQAVAYDPLRREISVFGGTGSFGSVVGSQTNVLQQNGLWRFIFISLRPQPRSQTGFDTDPSSNTIWMFGGLDETSSFFHTDLWGYRNGQWFPASSGPITCDNPLTAYDTDRNRLVVSCTGTDTYEFDGSAWKTFTELTKEPQTRRFAAMVYDPKLKKTIMFGGYNNNNYRDDTWTWDGTAWTELKMDGDDRPPHRGQAAMWYDPLQQKVILYGGIGRGSVNERVTRYSDMWAFDGTAWTELTIAEHPGARFGPQIGVNPVTGKVLLFGGLRVEVREDDPEGKALRQFFANDTWEWDGAASRWTRIETDPATPEPEVRENGSVAWDPVASQLVMYGGYAEGFYRSDVWEWTGQDWIPRLEHASRRRAAR